MDELNGIADKLFEDIDHLDRLLDCDHIGPEAAGIALSVAKRVRRESTLLVRALAQIRDNQLQPQEGTSE